MGRDKRVSPFSPRDPLWVPNAICLIIFVGLTGFCVEQVIEAAIHAVSDFYGTR